MKNVGVQVDVTIQCTFLGQHLHSELIFIKQTLSVLNYKRLSDTDFMRGRSSWKGGWKYFAKKY